jgi:DNA (cytosine-5)-methyltransferase 1
MTKRALDLFCKAGGATRGLQLAGFHVTGIDRDPQPHYVGDAFLQGDVFELIEGGDVDLDELDFVWASPPCQGRTAYKRRPGHVRPVDTDGAIARVRSILHACNTAWVIENVPGAPLVDPVTLCGSMFAETMAVRRHRCFESSFPLAQPTCRHELQRGDFPQATNRANRRKTAEIGVWRIPLDVQKRAMGIDWMELEELSEAIPPAYAKWIGDRWIAGESRAA